MLWLASTSPWRRKLLEDAGISASCEDPGVDESICDLTDPAARALYLGRAKAAAVAVRHPGDWVIGADQVVHQDGDLWGKPVDAFDHLRRLQRLRGEVHQLVTGWALLGPGPAAEGVVITSMHGREDVSDEELVAYVAGGEGRGCAGGYAAEGRGAFLFSRVDGDWFNVIGLPILHLLDALRQRGWRYGGAL